MIRAAKRPISLPINSCRRNRPLARCFNSYAQPFPFYDEPEGRYQPEPFPRYQSDHSFSQFHPGANSRDSRLARPFRNEFESYPVRVSWRGYGPDCYCRCCGRPFWGYRHQPVNYGFGNYRPEGVQGTSYDHSGRYQMRSDYYRNHSSNGFDGSSSYYPNGNAGQHGQNWGDNHYDTVGAPREKLSKEQNIANDGYRYREHQNGGGDGRDNNVWSRSISNFNQHAPGHGVNIESDKFHQQTGQVEQKNSFTNDQNSGRNISGQSQDVAVNGHSMNLDGAGGELQHARRSPGISNVLRNENHGSRKGNQNVNMQTSSNYNPAGVWGNYGHQRLNKRYYENLNGFRRSPDVSHGQSPNIDPNGGNHQKRFNAANIGEAGRIFPDNQGFKNDTFNAGRQTEDVNSLINSNGALPEFAATNQPLKSTVTSFETSQMPDINDFRNVGSRPRRMVDLSNDVSHRSNQAAGRCQRIIDVPENEDKHVPFFQSRNEYAKRPT